MKSFVASLILLGLLSISVAIRTYHLDDRVDYYNPCHMIMLTTLEIWNEEGLSKNHYSPNQTYSNEGDKFHTPYKRVEDQQGNNFYVSYPPFTFLLAHFFFKSTGIYPSQLPLQLINLFFHFVAALFLYLIICHHYRKPWQSLFPPALGAFAVYLFLPVTLFLHTLIYFPDMVGNVLWIAGIYIALKVFRQPGNRNLILLGIIIFFGVYSEWIGVLFAFAVAFSAWLYRKGFPAWKKVLIVATVASGLSLALTVVQYSSINGFESFFYAMKARLGERSGFLGEAYSGKGASIYSGAAWLAVARSFQSAFYAIGYLSLVLLSFIFVIRKISFKKLSQPAKILLLLSFVPAALHFFLFFNFNAAHYHAIAKFAIPLCIAIGLMIPAVTGSFNFLSRAALLIAFVCALIFSAVYFRNANPHAMDHPYLTEAAAIIQREAAKDETIYVQIESEVPIPFFYVSYMAKRNMVPADRAGAELMLLKRQEEGVFFHFNEKAATYSSEHFNFKPE